MRNYETVQYESANIYYFTGTGNTRRVALWFSDAASKNGLKTICKPIEIAEPKQEIEQRKRNMIVLGCPTHGFMPPYSMFRFACKLPRARGSKAVVFSTRAGLIFGKFHPPGLAGMNPFVLSLILLLKGYSLQGIKTINMPSNWIQIHPGYGEEKSRKIIDVSKRWFDRFTDKIFSGKRSLISVNNFYELIFGLLFLPIAVMYFLIGRFSLAKLNFASNRCDGCGLCSLCCPVDAIKMIGKRKKKPYWTFACEACNRCICYCPKKAIEASHHLLVFWVLITLSYSILHILHISSYFADLGMFTVHIREFMEVVLIFPLLFFAYFVFYLLMRIPPLVTLFTWTSPTHYYHRYQEPDTKIKDFVRK